MQFNHLHWFTVRPWSIKVALFAILILLTPAVATASLGSSESSCVAKYGENKSPGGIDKLSTCRVYTSEKSGIEIRALLHQNVVVYIAYTGNITPKLRKALMHANGKGWAKPGLTGKNEWQSGSKIANISSSSMVFTTKKYRDLIGVYRGGVRSRPHYIPKKATTRQLGGG